MKILKSGLLVVLVGLIILAIVAPVGPLPGFRIGGTITPPPAEWPDTSSIDEIRLRVPGTLPRVVIIWVVASAGELYVVGARGSGWVTMLGDGGPVEMRLGEETYPLVAVPVTEGWEDILTAYVEKYRPDYPDIVEGFPPIEEAAEQVAVFRLDRAGH